jgi:hypothetical protein
MSQLSRRRSSLCILFLRKAIICDAVVFGMTLLIMGVVFGIRIFHGHRRLALAPDTN